MNRYTDGGPLAGKLIRSSSGGDIALVGGTLIDGKGGSPIAEATVITRRGQILAVGPRAAISFDHELTRVVDTSGRHIIPGLIDCHVHLTGDRHADIHRRYMDATPRARVLRVAAQANVALQAGFTTVRHLGHGDPAHVAAVKAGILDGMIAGPRILTAGWSISQTGGHGNLPIWPYELVEAIRPQSAFADGLRETARLVRQNIAEGADVIKLYATEGVLYTPDRLSDIPNFSVEEISAMVSAAHQLNRRVAAHSTGVDSALTALEGGVDTIEHGPHVTDLGFLELMRKRNAVLVPTLSVFYFAANGGLRFALPPWVGERAARQLEGRFAVVRAARDLGIPIALGTDTGSPPQTGRNAKELELLVEAGLSPMEAIVAATRTSAAALGLEDEIGTLEAGKKADLLVLRVDPLADISSLQSHANIEYVLQSSHRGALG